MVDINGNKPEVMKNLARALKVAKSVEETATIMMKYENFSPFEIAFVHHKELY